MWLGLILNSYADFRKLPQDMGLISLEERRKNLPFKLTLAAFASWLIELSNSKDFVEKVRGRINKF